ncbi:glycosyltransferase family 2 protein [Kaistella polysaccharea]|uniref:glycosyltransferase family 2 protein n=1 Tax=Kaistella polysaccharea TaxID=2878534 RepID=UPI001CF2353D|nr:glycosyltransferase [Kaistella polysaccharea]
MKPAISILIANYNNGHYFKDAFESLIQQTIQKWEAIVIDDASTDNSVEVIKQLIVGDHRFQFYQNSENVGYQKTIARAISLSRAEIFGRLDPDDSLTAYALEISLNQHHQNPQAGLVYSDNHAVDADLSLLWQHNCEQIEDLNEKYYNLRGEVAHFATFKKSLYLLTSGIDPFIRRAEDKDIYMKMCEVAPVVHIPTVLYKHRQLEGSLSTNANQYKAEFWHWVALIKMMDRRNVDLEEIFIKNFVDRRILEKVMSQREKQNRWFKDNWVIRTLGQAFGKTF